MTFGESIKTCFNKYATFTGRATRPEFWYFFLLRVIVAIVLNIAAFTTNNAVGVVAINAIWNFGTLLPGLAVGVRRMHDVGKSGWFIIIPIYNLVLWARDGDQGPNEYGDDPLNPGHQFDFDRPNSSL